MLPSSAQVYSFFQELPLFETREEISMQVFWSGKEAALLDKDPARGKMTA
jgi:hypothetical protein